MGGFKEIYCGNFQGPIEKGKINKIILKFNFVLTNERREEVIIQSTSTENLIEKLIPLKEIEIINNSVTTTLPEDHFTPLETSTSSLRFFKFVYAQEIQTDILTEEQKAGENVSPTTSQNSDNFSTSIVENNLTSTDLMTQKTTSTYQSLFDVFYTLDGQNWEYLGSINNENWQNIKFEIPVNDWLLIRKIQIKVQSNPLINKIPYLYLESIVLEVEYSNTNNEEAQLFESNECLELKNKLLTINLNN